MDDRGGVQRTGEQEIVDRACSAAATVFHHYRALSLDLRAAFLERIAEELDALGDTLIETAMRETSLPRARLAGERARTTGQLRLFADVVRSGQWLRLRVDHQLADRQPVPRPDLRLRMMPVGPVAVFGASNFPLAFSTAGGDTASALAAGCPVVVKSHPAHPETGELVAAAIRRAAGATGIPDGVFNHVVGTGYSIGEALVRDPRIAAVGFTGSRKGGLALIRIAQTRPVPIPVYAEMSSVNPVLLLPNALAVKGAELGASFVESLTMGAGQFCTNPGLLIAIEGEGLSRFVKAASHALAQDVGAAMLTPEIHAAYEQAVSTVSDHADLQVVAKGSSAERFGSCAVLLQTTAAAFTSDPALSEEIFGPASLLVRCRDSEELVEVVNALGGQLTATVQMDSGDVPLFRRLMPILEDKAGRILANGWPTGVEVAHAMVHGGPFPATSDSRMTSVGSLSIERFLRPVSYQNMASELLPAELRDEALGVYPALVDGRVL